MVRSIVGCLVSFPLGSALVLGAALLATGWSVEAVAGVRIEAHEARSYALPAGFDLSEATIQSDRDGTTVITATTGTGGARACTIIVAAEGGARSYTYRYQDRATACLNAIAHPGGGFFVRGAVVADPDAEVIGFTARIDGEGREVWAVHDQRLVDAEEVVDGGPGDFLGLYGYPHEVMAYSERFDRLMAFTVGTLQVGTSTPEVTQAHIINGTSGRLRVNGLTFGQSGVGIVAGATERVSDGYFVLYIYSAGSQGAYFYSYNGDRNISFFRPRDEDWTRRYVRPPLTYGPDNHLHFLWLPTDAPDTQTHVTVIEDSGAEVWSASWSTQERVNGEVLEIGQAGRLWVGGEHSALLYRSAQGELYLRVLDVRTGRSLGMAPLEGVVDDIPVEILAGEGGALKLLALTQTLDAVREFELRFVETDGPGPGGGEPDAGSGGPDAGEGDDVGGGGTGRRSGDDEGCGCASAGDGRQSTLFSFLVLGALYALRTRRVIAKRR